MKNSKIIGIGTALGGKKQTFDDLVALGAPAELLRKWGISEKFLLAEDESSTDLEASAASRALENASVHPSEIDLVIGSAFYPEQPSPSNVLLTMRKLGMKSVPALTVDLSGTSFLVGMQIADDRLRLSRAKNVLIVGSSAVSPAFDLKDPLGFAVLGDGAGAVIMSMEGEGHEFMGSEFLGNGSHWERVGIKRVDSKDKFYMNVPFGDANFMKEVDSLVFDSISKLLTRSALTIEEIDWICPHQNVKNLPERWMAGLNITESKVLMTADKVGNLTLINPIFNFQWGVTTARIGKDQKVLLVSQGSGFCGGAALLQTNS